MRRPASIPAQPGVFALLHAGSKHAYVNETRDLKERAGIWSSYFNAFDRNGTPIRVRSWPRELKAPGDEWEFRFSVDPDITVEAMQAFLEKDSWNIIKARKRTQLFTVQGIDDTLIGHCKRLGIANWHAVYARVKRGKTPEEALGLTNPQR